MFTQNEEVINSLRMSFMKSLHLLYLRHFIFALAIMSETLVFLKNYKYPFVCKYLETLLD